MSPLQVLSTTKESYDILSTFYGKISFTKTQNIHKNEISPPFKNLGHPPQEI